ncbi:Hypothetical protein D9617_1g087290 [Elsinoe fawcettii]|nr:Hypothetical protein D9617_1g087290 [Elsinoe fawcettii]
MAGSETQDTVEDTLFVTETPSLGISSKRPSSGHPVTQPSPKKSRRELSAKVNYQGGEVEEYDNSEPFRYDVHEAVPRLTSSLQDYTRAEKLPGEAIRLFIRETDKVPHKGDEFGEVVSQMKSCESVDYGAPFKVALVGDMGAGKSTLLNSILAGFELAVQGNTGHAITQHTTEYVFDNRYGTEDIEVMTKRSTVVLKSKASNDKQISENFRMFISFHRADFRSLHAIEKDEGDAVDAENAKEFLLAIFADRPGGDFKSHKSLKSYVKKLKLETYNKTIKALQDYCENKIQQLCRDDGDASTRTIHIEQPTSSDLKKTLEIYSERPATGETGLWPLVDIVRTFVPTPLLAKGLVIVDCPGLSDKNPIRRGAAEKCLQDAQMVFVLIPIGRIASNPQLDRYLRHLLISKSLEDIVIVPTQIDAIGEPNETDPKEVGMDDHQRRVDYLRAQWEAAGQRHKQVPGGKGHAEQRTSALAAKSAAEAELQHARVIMRNVSIHQALQQHVPPEYAGQKIKVVCISSAQHKLYQDGTALAKHALLKMDQDGHGEDGIATIRNLMFVRAQQGRFQKLKDHVQTWIDIPLQRMQLILDKNPEERKESVFEAVELWCNEGLGCVRGYGGLLFKAFDRTVYRKMKSTNKYWAHCFTVLVKEWRMVVTSHNTLKAICRRNGRYYIKKQDMCTDWNGDIIGVFTPNIQVMVRTFREECDNMQAKVVESLTAMLDNLHNAMATNPDIGGINMTPIFALIKSQKQSVKTAVPIIFSELQDDINKIGQNILAGDNDVDEADAATELFKSNQESKLSRSMKNVYTAVTSDKIFPLGKKKITQRRWQLLKARLEDTGTMKPMSAFKSDIKQRCVHIIEIAEDKIKKIAAWPYDQIRADLNLRFGDYKDDLDEEARDAIKAALADAIPRTAAMFEEAKSCLSVVMDWENRNGSEGAERQDKKIRVRAEDFEDDTYEGAQDGDEDDEDEDDEDESDEGDEHDPDDDREYDSDMDSDNSEDD